MSKDFDMEKEKKSESLLYRLFLNSKKKSEPQEEEQGILSEQQQEPEISEQLPSEPSSDPSSEPSADAPQLEEPENSEQAESLEEQPEAEPIPVDATVEITTSSSNMEGYVTVLPPQNGGAEINGKQLRAALTEYGIVHGISDAMLLQIVLKKIYNQELVIAIATPRQDGVDGKIEEFYQRVAEIKPQHNIDGTVDFKEMNIINEVLEGAVISRLIAPTEGVDGMDIMGNVLKAIPGKALTLRAGENTYLNEEKDQLLAAKSGNLVYRDGCFCVQTVFTVNGNVDNATGNISFVGDVVVKGDVREGFEINSKGSVTVWGLAEGGFIYADGDVVIKGGFNGMMKGKLTSQSSVTSKFLQNCTVSAKGSILTESVINSTIYCDDNLLVNKGKGVIAGGSCTVLKSVEAKIIGTPSNTPTVVMVGITHDVVNQKNMLETELKDILSNNDLIGKNLAYLELVETKMPLTEKQKQLLKNCHEQTLINTTREAKVKEQLETLESIILASGGSSIQAQTIYPSTRVAIMNQIMVVKTIHNRCRFQLVEGELQTIYY